MIPCFFVTVKKNGSEFQILVDAIKGMVLLDPDTDKKIEAKKVSREAEFLRFPSYQQVEYDQSIAQKLTEKNIEDILSPFCIVKDMQLTNVIYHKVEY